MKRVLLIFLIFLASCNTSREEGHPYTIARDPSWLPLQFKEMTSNINGFTNGLVLELAKVENRPFALVDVAWNQLFDGLERDEYGGIFTSLGPNPISIERYSFSDPLLLLGPVLVVPIDSPAHSLADLRDRTVQVFQYDDSVLIVQKYPSILIETYQNSILALEDVAQGKASGALVPNLEARALITALYPDRLKIATEPLSDKGIRVITLKDQNQDLLQDFNAGLTKLKEKGAYQNLLNNFGIMPKQKNEKLSVNRIRSHCTLSPRDEHCNPACVYAQLQFNGD